MGFTLGYRPGLDGLRTLTVGAVILNHAKFPWARGGGLGVDLFFVLSGFLITALLIEEHQRDGRVDLRAFWLRRYRRLAPALAMMLVVVVLVPMMIGGPGPSARGLVAAATWTMNLWRSILGVGFGPIGHLWSLGIEEQFYLLWPVLLPLALRRFGRGRTAAFVAAGVGASVLLMGATADVTAPDRAYYGTDTRAFGILLGCLLAFSWRPERARVDIGRAARGLVDVVGALALVALLWQFANRSEFDPWTYPSGMLLVDACTLVLLVAATHPASTTSRRLGAPLLAALGRRSYSLYLWHWPVIVFTRPGVDWGLSGAVGLIARLVLIGALAELSYRFVEQPFRDGRAQRRVAGAVAVVRHLRWPRLLAASCVATALGATTALVAAPPPVRTVETTRAPISVASPATTEDARPDATSGSTPTGQPVTADDDPTTTAPATTAPPATVPPTTTSAPAPPPPPVGTEGITVVGESVTLGAEGAIRGHYGNRLQFDAVEGRQASESIEAIERMAAEQRLTPIVVVHIGNNGVLPPGGLDRVVAAAGPERQLVLVTVRVPRRWEGPVNDEVRRVAAEAPNAALADWHHIANNEPGLLIDDGVHLTAAGQHRYTRMLAELHP